MEDHIVLSARHPLLDGHRIDGKALLPGLAYLDLIYSLGRERGVQLERYALNDLTLHTPLFVEDDALLVLTLRWQENSAGEYQLSIEGGVLGHNKQVVEKRRFATANLRGSKGHGFASNYRTDDVKEESEVKEDLSDLYARCASLGLVHGETMRAHGTVFLKESQALVELEVASEPGSQKDEAQTYLLHPALIDGSGLGSAGLFSRLFSDNATQLYLPLHIGSFRATQPIRDKVVTRVKASSVHRRRELVTVTFEFFDPATGVQVAELTDITCKTVRQDRAGLMDVLPNKKAPRLAKANVQGAQQKQGSRTGTISFIVDAIARQLGIDYSEIDADRGFYDLGLDSGSLLEIADVIMNKVGISLPPTLLFEHANIRDLATWLESEHGAVLVAGQDVPHSVEFPRESAIAAAAKSLSPTTDIAVIGMAGRYPGAEDLTHLWENLLQGRDGVQEVPLGRWSQESVSNIYSPSGKPVSRWGGFIEAHDCFDARFFGITPREAEVMDPQERIFLETAWSAIEDAGYTPDTLADISSGRMGFTENEKSGLVGVFVGAMQSDYALVQYDSAISGSAPLATNRAPLANRVSYACNFQGPSVVVDTACSSSLVAIHMAMQSLVEGECQVAIAGGVNLSLHSAKYVSCALMDMHSSDGRCRSFGAGGDGYVSAEGCGAVVLKPLDKAQVDGDSIYGVIRASASNHGGTVAGMMVPSPSAQGSLISRCLSRAGIDARTISYVEAHGTGTSLGDPIEIDGLTRAYRQHTSDKQYCAIGSIKSNFGHAEAAAGIAGLTKVLLQMRYGTLVPSLHADPINPHVDFSETPFFVQQTTATWQRPVSEEGVTFPRRAAVSAFGASGTNAHLIVDEYSERTLQPETAVTPSVVVLSAMDPETLRRYAERLLAFLSSPSEAGAGIEHHLAVLLADQLNVSPDLIDYDVNWSEFGLDATGLKQFAHALDGWLAVEGALPGDAIVYSVATLADYLRQEYSGALSTILSNVATETHGQMTLSALAYTLQLGRKALPERVAFVSNGMAELISQLWVFASDDDASPSNCYRGRAPRDNSEDEVAAADYAGAHEMAAAWAVGKTVDWISLYGGRTPGRVNLPTYPFVRKRYWVESATALDSGSLLSKAARIESTTRDQKRVQNAAIPDSKQVSGTGDLGADPTQLKAGAKLAVATILQKVTKLPDEDIYDELTFEELNLDSLMLAAINQRIEALTGDRDTTLLFRFRSVGELADHLSWRYPKACQQSTICSVLTPVAAPHSSSTSYVSTADVSKHEATQDMDIAIIGLAGRYPSAADVTEFWANLRDGRDCVSEIPSGRWDLEGFYEPDPERAAATGKSCCKWGGFLSEVDKFDPLFFNITPKEARLMDPHERLFLEVAWQCVEDAGLTREALYSLNDKSGIGVFVGTSFNNYQLIMSESAQQASAQYYPASSQVFSIANRVSYVMNFTGPSMTVDTACSSSLYALHFACESLRAGQANLALAGGVNLSLHPSKYVSLSLGRFLAIDGRCRAFDEGGTGYVPGEAVGAVLLKPLADARRDRDHIWGVIKGSGVSHGGRTNGYAVPNPDSQAQAIRNAFRQAKVKPRSVTYLEAHGTGTELGDPIELAGLNEVFRESSDDTGFCSIASVKTMIGHSEAAAGIAQLTKVLLQMKYKTLVPNLSHGAGPNPNLNFSVSPFKVVRQTQPWEPGPSGIRRAGISSFGAGGANAHVIVDEYPFNTADHEASQNSVDKVPVPLLFVLSAKDEKRLRAQADQLSKHVVRVGFSNADLADIAYTLQVGREALNKRAAFVGHELGEVLEILQAISQGEYCEKVAYGSVRIAPTGRASADADLSLRSERACFLWPDSGKASELPALWVKGAAIDWNLLYGEWLPRRLSLPPYPFAKESYWVPGIVPGSAIPASRDASVGTVQGDVGELSCVSESGESVPEPKPEGTGVLMLEPVWRVSPCDSKDGNFTASILVLFEVPAALEEAAISAANPGHSVITLRSEKSDIAEHYTDFASKLFELVKKQLESLSSDPEMRVMLQVAAPSEEQAAGITGLSALLKTATQENPRLAVQWIGFDSWPSSSDFLAYIAENHAVVSDIDIRYRGRERHTRHWEERAHPEVPFSWRPRGVFLITGGAGGLGGKVATSLARVVECPTIVLVGRSEQDKAQEKLLESLQALGAHAEYRQADVGSKEDCGALIDACVESHGALHGVIHCAGILSDGFIVRKEITDLERVFAPKVAGLVNLDWTTRRLPLDLMLLFSSAAGAVGNVGQADYAAANAFMDAFSSYRTMLVARGERHGRTCSVGWPVWRDGGMRVDQATLEAIEKRAGMLPLTISDGMQSMQDCLALSAPYLMVAAGHVQILRKLLGSEIQVRIDSPAGDEVCLPEEQAEPDSVLKQGGTPSTLEENLVPSTIRQLKRLLSEATGLPVTRIDAKEALENYGVDSVIVMTLNRELCDVFGSISQTLLFEFGTLGALAENLTQTYPDECRHWGGVNVAERAAVQAVAKAEQSQHESVEKPTFSIDHTARAARGMVDSSGGDSFEEPIAIIGIAGRYPQADDLQAFWRNLSDGVDCITTIPSSRWPLQGFFEPERAKALASGKSYSKWGGFVDRHDCFDAPFFHMSPLEAINLDPQIRLFIETCWAVLEDAGYTRRMLAERYEKRVGVFAGITKTGYSLFGPKVWPLNEHYNPQTSFSAMVNRVSYLLDLHGPSIPVDTMCSSSLTAIHEACGHIRSGACELAIAGGVNLYLHPSNYLELCGMQMLSSDGRCKSFGDGADGFVPGEGVGAVLLKPMSAALADRDNIHALIRGTGINHGGKVNGFTVPSPNAQRDLIQETLRAANISPREVGYVEAHGTGTDLGDPIEVTALTQAFSAQTADAGFCALGSVKSNIGHLEAAAGIAGLTKVVLQLKHGVRVPTLHAKVPNRNITFERTPFVLQQTREDWPQAAKASDEKSKASSPRIAAVSSFGAGGANAHILVQDAPERTPVEEGSLPALIVLSARNRERLLARVRQLEAMLRNGTDYTLSQVAYTLQTGREAMEERLALIVDTVDMLTQKLGEISSSKAASETWDPEQVEAVYVGRGGAKMTALSFLADDEDIGKTILTWVEKGKLELLAQSWVNGIEFEWEHLYPNGPPWRVSLPTYPFAAEQYSLPDVATKSAGEPQLHPLLQRNVSTLTGVRFSSTFTGDESFLRDHQVAGHPMLPAVAYLEMAYIALHEAGQPLDLWCLNDWVWLRPAVINDEPIEMFVELWYDEDGRMPDGIVFEISSQIGALSDHPSEQIVHARGRARRKTGLEVAPVALTDCLDSCRSVLTMDACYSKFKTLGMEYGPSFQKMGRLHCGDDLAVAELVVSDSADLADGPNTGILDAGLQAALGLAPDSQSDRPLLPFALDSFEVFGPRPEQVYCVVSREQEAGDGLSLNITLCDRQGQPWVALGGFVLRHFENASVPGNGLLTLVPEWRSVDSADAPVQQMKFQKRIVFLCDGLYPDVERESDLHFMQLDVTDSSVAQRFNEALKAVLKQVQMLMQQKPVPNTLLQVVVPDKPWFTPMSGLAGFFRTLAQEQPAFCGQVILVPPTLSLPELETRLQECGEWPRECMVRYSATGMELAGWREWYPGVAAQTERELHHVWRDNGVYLVTGGSGGLACILAENMFRNAPTGRMMLVGRSALSGTVAARVKSLRSEGAQIDYTQADCADESQMRALVTSLIRDHGRLDGIVHAAGALCDSFIQHKTEEDLGRVLRPKVDGVIALDRATRDVALKFFVFFASVAGQTGNPGQADYASANGFMDGFARYRNFLVEAGERSGRSVSIDWPLWREGGMQIDSATEALLMEQTGMCALPTEDGLALFHRAVQAEAEQLMGLYGDRARLQALIAPMQKKPTAGVSKQKTAQIADLKVTRSSGRDLTADVRVDWLRTNIADLLEVDPRVVDSHVPLIDFGVDPQILTNFAVRIGTDVERLGVDLTLNQIAALSRWGTMNPVGPESVTAASVPEKGGSDELSVGAQDITEGRLVEATLKLLAQCLGGVIKLPSSRIDADTLLETYGIDSVVVMQVIAELEKTFGSLPKTLFFEYTTLREIAAHLQDKYPHQVRELAEKTFGTARPTVAATDPQLGSNAKAPRESFEKRRTTSHDTVVPFTSKSSIKSIKEVAKSVTSSAVDEAPVNGVALNNLDVAIVGVAGRYPMANDLESFWDNLVVGRDCVTEIPASRWDYRKFYDPEKGRLGKSYCKWGGFLDDVARFDAGFFNISPREAQIMDPQERLFLECVYHTLEDAGYTRHTVSSTRAVGVYVGVMYEEYQLYGVQRMLEGMPVALTGNPAAIANRVSYFCNFRGPSVAIDTMCSSSLTAIHMACQSLLLGECEVALAGGVNVSIHPNKYQMLSQGQFASSKGRCESFGEGGDGYVPGEGVGAVLLKTLAKAEQDGDQIYGVIKATALNHGGRTNGYTVPNPNAQAEVIYKALERAKIDARSIGYIEAHGTGTSLGDPIEIAGLTKAFERVTGDKGFCAIGSVKSNIGHAESAAGIAGLTKVLLQMRHRKLAPSLHATPLNPNIAFDDTPFVVQTHLAPWENIVLPDEDNNLREMPLRAGLSSFGAGGANAHVIVEEYRATSAQSAPALISLEEPVLVVLSARKADRLSSMVERLDRYLGRMEEESGKESELGDLDAFLRPIAYTLQIGREAMDERLCIVTSSFVELRQKLDAILREDESVAGIHKGKNRPDSAAIPADALTDWYAKGRFDAIATAWASGRFNDWSPLYSDQTPRRISLPGYAFAQTRFWVPDAEQLAKAGSRGAGTARQVLSSQPQAPTKEPERDLAPRMASVAPATSVAMNTGGIMLEAPESLVSSAGTSSTDIEKPENSIKLSLPGTHNDMGGAVSLLPKGEPSAIDTSEPPVSAQTSHWKAENVQEKLRSLLAEALYLDESEIESDMAFVDLGVDSIIGIEWVKALSSYFEVSLTATKLYDNPTLSQLTKHVLSLLSQKAKNELTEVQRTHDDAGTADQPVVEDSVRDASIKEIVTPESTTAGSDESLVELQQIMAQALADALLTSTDDIGLDTVFNDLGLDSIIGVEWVQAINERLGVSIAATKIYDHATLRDFSRYVLSQLPSKEGGGIASFPSAVVDDAVTISLDEVLQRVHRGELDISQAESLLRENAG